MRLRLDLGYDGTHFHGWARQPGLRTVQGELESALARVLRVPEVPVTCAGRTDTGVHARGQVAHLDVATPPDGDLVRRLNGALPEDVRVRAAAAAPDGFDARFSALWRRYAYRIADLAPVDPLQRRHVVARPRALDLGAMTEAAASLLGEHDFAAYCRRRVGASTTRTLLELRWGRDGDGLAVATVRADAFCHHMVRGLVGALVAVGEGRRTTTWPGEVLAAAVRDPAVTTMPAHGLVLEEVAYPPQNELAARATRTRRVRG